LKLDVWWHLHPQRFEDRLDLSARIDESVLVEDLVRDDVVLREPLGPDRFLTANGRKLVLDQVEVENRLSPRLARGDPLIGLERSCPGHGLSNGVSAAQPYKDRIRKRLRQLRDICKTRTVDPAQAPENVFERPERQFAAEG